MGLQVQHHPRRVTNAGKERIWQCFKDGGTTHSASAATLSYVIERCESEGEAYVLHAQPGLGYFIKPIAKVEVA